MSGMSAPAPPASGINDIHHWVKFVGDPQGYAAKLIEFQKAERAAKESGDSAQAMYAEYQKVRDALAKEQASFLDLKTATDHEHSTALTTIADRSAAVKAREDAVTLREEKVTRRINKFESDNKDVILQLETREKTIEDREKEVAQKARDVERMRKQLQAKLDAIAAIHQAGQ